MPDFIPAYDDAAVIARELAAEIIARRRTLDAEEQERRAARQRGVKGRSLPGRGNRLIHDDWQRITGMLDALAVVLGCPGQPWNAEQFIAGQEQDQEKT